MINSVRRLIVYSRDSIDEEEDDDVITGCQTLSKRPRWMTSPYSSTLNMAADGELFFRLILVLITFEPIRTNYLKV